jgi:hypothetical protein
MYDQSQLPSHFMVNHAGRGKDSQRLPFSFIQFSLRKVMTILCRTCSFHYFCFQDVSGEGGEHPWPLFNQLYGVQILCTETVPEYIQLTQKLK